MKTLTIEKHLQNLIFFSAYKKSGHNSYQEYTDTDEFNKILFDFLDMEITVDPNTKDITELFKKDKGLLDYLGTDLSLVNQYIDLSTGFTTNNFFEELKEYEKVKDKLTLRQIALLYIYQSKWVSSFNADEIAKEHGHSSGQKLTEHFSNLNDDNNRVRGNSKRADASLLKDIKKVLPLLEEPHKQKAESDIEKLEDNLLSY